MKFFLIAIIAATQQLDSEMGIEPTSSESPIEVETQYMDYVDPPSFSSCKDLMCETFQQEPGSRWKNLTHSMYDGTVAYEGSEDEYVKGQKRAVLKDSMKFHGFAAELNGIWQAKSKKPLVYTMDVRFGKGHTCGGGYVKLFSKQTIGAISTFDNKDNYSIMFGPDRCGAETRKVHFIAQYDALDGSRVEEHLIESVPLPPDMHITHQYGFALNPDDTLKIYVDGEETLSGNLRELTTPGWKSSETIADPEDPVPEGWTPPPEMLVDETAVKPDDWDESAPEMIEEYAEKPEGWLDDEPLLVPNMNVKKPEDWNDEEDGEWQRPLKKNPKCYEVGCGEWKPQMVPNPNYRGKWEPPKIPNPDYVSEYKRRQIPNPQPYNYEKPYGVIENVDALGFELWSVEPNTAIDNIWVGTDITRMLQWVKETWKPTFDVESTNAANRIMNATTTESERDEKNHYLKLGMGAIIAAVIVVMTIRKLVRTGACCAAKNTTVDAKHTDKTENETQPTTAPNSAAATETVASGETQPKKRN